MKRKIIWPVILVTAGILLFAVTYQTQTPSAFVAVKIGNAIIQVEIADTPEKRTQGLSERNAPSENEGMIFIFDKPDYYGIWMKDMKFPIDVIWISDDKKVADVAHDVLPDTYPQIFKPRVSALYILEVNAGFIKNGNIKIGDAIGLE